MKQKTPTLASIEKNGDRAEKKTNQLLERMYRKTFSPAQNKLRKKHGTPAEFAAAVYKAVPGYISMDEAAAGIEKYNQEWAAAARNPKAK